MTDIIDHAPPKLVIVDSGLTDDKGHHFPYLASILPELRRRRVEVSIYANRRVSRDVTATIGAIPHFEEVRLEPGGGRKSRSRLRNHLRAVRRMIHATRGFYLDLARLGPVLRRPGTVVFDPNCDAANLLGHLLRRWHDGRTPDISHVLLVRRPLKVLGWLSAICKLRAALGLSKTALGLRFATDSKRIRDAFPLLDMRVLPIPHTLRKIDAGQCRELEARLEPLRGCRFLYLGRCRAEQGIATLERALGDLRQELAGESMCAVVQAAAYEDDRDALAACSRLRDLKLPHVVLLERLLADAEYAYLLRWTDAVLVPYAADAYRFRTSGIVAEALAAGRPVITSAGTWMGDQLMANTGLVFESGDPDSLASVMRRAAKEKASLLRGATDEARSFAAFHNPACFVEMLLSEAR